MIQKILRPFANTFAVNDKHYLLNRDNLTHPIQRQLCQKQKSFSSKFFFYFSNVYYILNIYQKTMNLIADVFWEIPAPKNMVR